MGGLLWVVPSGASGVPGAGRGPKSLISKESGTHGKVFSPRFVSVVERLCFNVEHG